jgi:hypothetical protein
LQDPTDDFVPKGPQDLSLRLGGLLDGAPGLLDRAGPPQAGMETLELSHGLAGSHRDPGALQAHFNELQVAKYRFTQ